MQKPGEGKTMVVVEERASDIKRFKIIKADIIISN
jgi:hypothetical protein